MTDTDAALLAAIRANPEDDTARLVYADWCDENGTTDQHRARSEWIRMTCDDRSKRAQKPTGKRVRKPGEVGWLKANCHRLWPRLHAALGTQARFRMTYTTGGIVFRVPVAVRSELTDTPYMDSTQVVLRAERGVATLAWVTFLRGEHSAPPLAADEPCVPIQFSSEPDRCFEFSSNVVYVLRRPFERRGLAGVWDRLSLEESSSAFGDGVRRKWAPQVNVVYNTDHVRPLLYAALTEWAKEGRA